MTFKMFSKSHNGYSVQVLEGPGANRHTRKRFVVVV